MAQRDEREQTADDVSKLIDDVETGGRSLPRDESGGCPDYGPDGIRHKGGVTLNRALARNVGTCRPDAKGEVQIGGPHEDESTDAGHRGGAARSSGSPFTPAPLQNLHHVGQMARRALSRISSSTGTEREL